MTYGICNLTAIAMRKEARHASEMVSQLLYNETYTVLDTTKEWLLIQTEDKPSAIQQDHESGIEDSGSYPYQGWIQAKQFCEISEEEFNAMKGKTPYLINKPVANYNGLLLTMGTPLYEPHPDAVLMPSEFHPDLMVDYAKQLLGAPYLWGGRMSMGLDCSGLTKVCARLAGLVLPRVSTASPFLWDVQAANNSIITMPHHGLINVSVSGLILSMPRPLVVLFSSIPWLRFLCRV